MDQEQNEETGNSVAALQLITEAIEAGLDEDLEEYLGAIPLGTMKIELSNELLKYFLDLTYYFNKQSSAVVIINHWRDINPMELLQPIRTTLYTISSIEVETLKFVENTDPNGSYMLHMINLINYNSGPEMGEACDKLVRVFGEPDETSLKGILDEIDFVFDQVVDTNKDLKEYVLNLYREISSFAPIPSWVLYEDPILTHDELISTLPINANVSFEIPSDEEGALLMTEAFGNLPGTIVEDKEILKDTIYDRLSNASISEKIMILAPIMKGKSEYNMYTDETIFRVLGPAHPITGIMVLDTSSDSPCSKWGGCRMMTCYEFENVDDETGEVIDEDIEITGRYDMVDWFKGYCDSCNKRIRQKHHAVRMPIEMGGWIGCYCSWKCVKDDVRKPNPIRMMIASEFEEQFSRIGILDRIWPEKEVYISNYSADEILREITKGQGLGDASVVGIGEDLRYLTKLGTDTVYKTPYGNISLPYDERNSYNSSSSVKIISDTTVQPEVTVIDKDIFLGPNPLSGIEEDRDEDIRLPDLSRIRF